MDVLHAFNTSLHPQSSSRSWTTAVVVAAAVVLSFSPLVSTVDAWKVPQAGFLRRSIEARGFDKTKYQRQPDVAQSNSTSSGVPVASVTSMHPDDVAKRLHVRPLARAPSWVWKVAWRSHKRLLLPVLHYRDAARARNVDNSLVVLWMKALAALDPRSPVYEYQNDDGDSASSIGWTCAMLPAVGSRVLVPLIRRLRLIRLFPRLHHGNIELRTTYLNDCIEQEIDYFGSPAAATGNDKTRPRRNIRVISFGAGYDVRATRLLSTGRVQQAFELDVPSVTASKQIMLERLQRRLEQQEGVAVSLPTLVSIDLNNITAVESTLRDIMSTISNDSGGDWHTIFVFEGVLIYLDSEISSTLLQLCASSLKPQRQKQTQTGSLCFADLLKHVPGGDYEAAQAELARAGWELISWCPKPGLARHMGQARSLSYCN